LRSVSLEARAKVGIGRRLASESLPTLVGEGQNEGIEEKKL
jgi:hypothetical protein